MVSCTQEGASRCVNNTIYYCRSGNWVPTQSGSCPGYQARYILRQDFFDALYNDSGVRGNLIDQLNTKVSNAYPDRTVALATYPSVLEFFPAQRMLGVNFTAKPDKAFLGGATGMDWVADVISLVAVIAGILLLLAIGTLGLPALLIGGALIITAGAINYLSRQNEVKLSDQVFQKSVIDSTALSGSEKASILDAHSKSLIDTSGGDLGSILKQFTNIAIIGGAVVLGIIIFKEVLPMLKK